MPVFMLRAPDGRVARITAPEGATEQQAMDVWMSSGKPMDRPPPPQEEVDAAPGGFVHGLVKPLDAMGQMAYESLPQGVTGAVDKVNNWLSDRGLPLRRIPEKGYSQDVMDREHAYQEARRQRGESGIDWPSLAGTAVTGGAAALALPAAGAGGLAARMGAGAALGGGLGAGSEIAQPGTDFWPQKIVQAGEGAMVGGAFGGLGRTSSGFAETVQRPDIQRLRGIGVEPTTGQYLGRTASSIEEKLGSIPVAGESIAGARGRAQEQFNRGVIDEAIRPVVNQGRTSGQAVGHEGIAEANRIVSDAYREAADMIAGVPIDAQATREFGNLTRLVRGSTLTETETAYNRFRADFTRKLQGSAGMEPITFKQMDSELATRIRDTADMPEARAMFQEFRRILQDAAARHSPGYAHALRAANRAYAQMAVVNKAAERSAINEGVFTPGQLLQSSKSGERSSHGFAEGRGLMQETGEAGQRVLGNRVPNSGTSDRAMAAMMATGAGGGFLGGVPGAIAGAGLAGAYTRPAQSVINAILRGTAYPARFMGEQVLPRGGTAASAILPQAFDERSW